MVKFQVASFIVVVVVIKIDGLCLCPYICQVRHLLLLRIPWVRKGLAWKSKSLAWEFRALELPVAGGELDGAGEVGKLPVDCRVRPPGLRLVVLVSSVNVTSLLPSSGKRSTAMSYHVQHMV